jgi:hypothetical protein
MSREPGKRTLEERLEYLHQLVIKQMKNNNEYRRRAADAQRKANKARNADDRAAWLRVAHGWLSLICKGRQLGGARLLSAAEKKERLCPAQTPRIEAASSGRKAQL